jgi:hypothetical protein
MSGGVRQGPATVEDYRHINAVTVLCDGQIIGTLTADCEMANVKPRGPFAPTRAIGDG